MSTQQPTTFPQYEADEKPVPLVALGLGVQSALLAIAPIALFPIVLAQAVDASAQFAAWAVFSMLIVNGAATVAQAFRFGPFGAGMIVVPYPSPTTIPFCVLALQEGGYQHAGVSHPGIGCLSDCFVPPHGDAAAADDTHD